MANITPTVARVIGQNGLDGYQVTWGPMTFTGGVGDKGLAVGSVIGDGAAALAPTGANFLAGFADKSVEVTGTFGSGGSLAIEGNNVGANGATDANWLGLTDPQGNTIAITSAAIKAITEAVIWLRPHVTAGDGTTSLTVTMFFRKTQTP